MDVPGQGWREESNPDSIGDLLSDRQNLLWLDICDPGPAELEWLQREFGFHELALVRGAKAGPVIRERMAHRGRIAVSERIPPGGPPLCYGTGTRRSTCSRWRRR